MKIEKKKLAQLKAMAEELRQMAWLRTIAKETRHWAEAFAEVHGFGSDLAEMCGIVSAELMKRLKTMKFRDVTICETHTHCYVTVKINEISYLVDLTASQFGQRNIIIKPIKGKLKKNYWEAIVRRHKTPEALLKWQKKIGWPKNQWADGRKVTKKQLSEFEVILALDAASKALNGSGSSLQPVKPTPKHRVVRTARATPKIRAGIGGPSLSGLL